MPCLNAAEALTDSRPLKVGLVGCGGRGLGAMKNALDADPGTVVWALADVFRERIDFGSNLLTEQYGSRVQLDKSRLFDGLDGYKKLLQTDIDVVLLCTPPAFRPEHLAAAIDAGKHIYAEKPVAVDVPGVLSVLESARLAKLKNLVILDGFCWRYDKANEEAHRKLSSGELGRVLSFDGLYYTTPPKSPLALDSRPSSDTDVAWALRNWTAWELAERRPVRGTDRPHDRRHGMVHERAASAGGLRLRRTRPAPGRRRRVGPLRRLFRVRPQRGRPHFMQAVGRLPRGDRGPDGL